MLINYWPFEEDTKDHIGKGSNPGGGISTINGKKCRGDWFGVEFGQRLNGEYTVTFDLCRVKDVADWCIDCALLSSTSRSTWGEWTSTESGLLRHNNLNPYDHRTKAYINGKITQLDFNYNDNKWHHYEFHGTGNKVVLHIDGKYWWTGYDGVRPGAIIFGNAGSLQRGGVYVSELKVYDRYHVESISPLYGVFTDRASNYYGKLID